MNAKQGVVEDPGGLLEIGVEFHLVGVGLDGGVG